METKILSADIVIVGLGPTGLVLGNILGLQGWRVVAFEREEDVYYAPRAVHFDDEIMRIFQAIGLSEAIAPSSEVFTEMALLGKPGGKPLLRAKIGSQDMRYGHEGAWWFHQPTLERHLWEGIARFTNVTAFRGANVLAVEQDTSTVQATAKLRDGQHLMVQAKYLVGCDGGRSFVRKAAGLRLASAGFDEAWVVVDTKSRCGGKDPALPAHHTQICDPRQPITYVPMAGPYYEWQFMVTGGKSEQDATNPAFVRSQLKQFVALDRVEINRIAHYRFHALWATEWRNERIVLAGDAAHQMPPFLGQGMCSGIRDAEALGWRLDLILRQKANEALLDSYEVERLDHVSHIIKGAIFLGRIIQTRNRWLALLRNTLLFWPARRSSHLNQLVYRIANRKQPLRRGFFGHTRPRAAGRLAIQPRVFYGGKYLLLDDVSPGGFLILARQGTFNNEHAAIDRLAHQFNVTVQEIGPFGSGAPVVDLDEKLLDWMDGINADFVIIRPDHYVFDAGRAADFSRVAAELTLALNPPLATQRHAA